VQPEAVVGECPVHEQDGRTAIAKGAQAMQRELDTVGRGDAPRTTRHS
jgi:hypothetical protein